MRILVASDVTGYMRGGVPAVTKRLIEGLNSRGHTIGYFGDRPVSELASVGHFAMTFPAASSFQAEFRSAVKEFRPDFIHVMSMNSRGVLSMHPVLKGLPWLLTCHSIPPNERKFPGYHNTDWLHYAVRNSRFAANTLAWIWLLRSGVAPHLIVHSAGVAATARKYGHDPSRTTVIQLGCDEAGSYRTATHLRSATAPLLVTTGGIAHTKGYHDAIRAVASLVHEFPSLRYEIIGEVRDESYLTYLTRLVRNLGLDAHVAIASNVSNADKNKALDAADLYVQPSHEEGFCLAYLEAALRVPRIVGTDTGAISLISASDEGAALVPVQRPARLAESMAKLLHRDLSADSMAQRFARLKQDFCWSRYLTAHEEIYERLLNGRFVDPSN